MAVWTYWFAAAVLVFVAEMFTGTVYLLVLSASCAGAGLASWLFGAGTVAGILTAAVLSAVGTAWVYQLRRSRPHRTHRADDFDIGGTVQLERPLSGGRWRVFYRGTTWEARTAVPNAEFQMGDNARICGKDGIMLLIEPV